MNKKRNFIAAMLAIAMAGCGNNEDAGDESAAGDPEQISQPSAANVVDSIENAATDSLEVIEANVESIEANIEKGQNQSTVSLEKLPESVAEQTRPSAGVAAEQEEIVQE